jgi:hypothetical protein
MCSCSNCGNCEFVTEKWEHGEVIGSYDACKIDNTIITDIELLVDCKYWIKRKVKPFDFTIALELNECPF